MKTGKHWDVTGWTNGKTIKDQIKCPPPLHSIGFLDSEPLKETDEDSEVNLKTSILTEEEREEIMQELDKVCAKTV